MSSLVFLFEKLFQYEFTLRYFAFFPGFRPAFVALIDVVVVAVVVVIVVLNPGKFIYCCSIERSHRFRPAAASIEK